MSHLNRRNTDHPNSALMEANALLRTVIDENPNIILMKDWDGKFLLGNRALAQLYGTTTEGLVGKDDGAFNPNAEQVAFYLQNVRQVMSQGQPQTVLEESTNSATGQTQFYQSIKIPLTGAQGQKQILVIANDVTELKQTQQKLEASERRLSYVLEATGEGVWDWNVATGIVNHNRRWCQISGMDEQFLQHPLSVFSELLHPDDKDLVLDRLRQCLAGQAPYHSEHRMCLPNHRVVWVQDRGNVVERDAQGVPLRMVGSVVDISLRKAAQQQVQEHSAQLDAMFALSPDGFVAFDEAHCVSLVSPAFSHLTGLPASQVLGLAEAAFVQQLDHLCQPATGFAGLDALRALQPPAQGVEPRMVIELAASATCQHRVLAITLRSAGAHKVSDVLYLRDITHESEVDRLKSEFLSTAAHELRTPMASIYGFAEVLREQKITAKERKEFVDIIYHQASLMSSILNELLDIARIEARRGKDFVIAPTSAQALVASVVDNFHLPSGRSAPALSLPEADLQLLADPQKAAQALLNVLSNAYKYSSAPSPVLIVVAQRGAHVGIDVTDQGVGMSPEQSHRVGERFYRADDSGKVPGTGLGMSIVKEIMALLHGSFAVNSQPGKGSVVSLVFPLATVSDSRKA